MSDPAGLPPSRPARGACLPSAISRPFSWIGRVMRTQATVPSAASKVVEEEDDRIHVFSLATGHMYERLVRVLLLLIIVMVYVM